jgi:hypothetical protein
MIIKLIAIRIWEINRKLEIINKRIERFDS